TTSVAGLWKTPAPPKPDHNARFLPNEATRRVTFVNISAGEVEVQSAGLDRQPNPQAEPAGEDFPRPVAFPQCPVTSGEHRRGAAPAPSSPGPPARPHPRVAASTS